MEISKLTSEGIKIKTKNVSFLVDSLVNPDQHVVLYTNSKAESPLLGTEEITLNGEGEYEIAGVLIHAYNIGDSVVYTLTDSDESILLFPSSVIKQMKDFDDYNAVVVKAENTLDDSFVSSLSSVTPILFADGPFLEQLQSIKKLPKVNISKREEIEESMIQLVK